MLASFTLVPKPRVTAVPVSARPLLYLILVFTSNTRLSPCVYAARIQAPVASNSFGAGHAGVAHDVELLQQGWLEARGADSAIYDQVRLLFWHTRAEILSSRARGETSHAVSVCCFFLCTSILIVGPSGRSWCWCVGIHVLSGGCFLYRRCRSTRMPSHYQRGNCRAHTGLRRIGVCLWHMTG